MQFFNVHRETLGWDIRWLCTKHKEPFRKNYWRVAVFRGVPRFCTFVQGRSNQILQIIQEGAHAIILIIKKKLQ